MFSASEEFLAIAISSGVALTMDANRSRARSTVANIAGLSMSPATCRSRYSSTAAHTGVGKSPRTATFM